MLTNIWMEPVLKIVLAGLLGALLGFNRERAGKPLGFRTLSIVSIASCSLTVAAKQYDLSLDGDADTVGRAIQGLMAGIGFLGGGVILQTPRHHIRGLTTAAMVWLTAALGIACGLGARIAVTASAVTALALLWAGGSLEKAMQRQRRSDTVRIVDR